MWPIKIVFCTPRTIIKTDQNKKEKNSKERENGREDFEKLLQSPPPTTRKKANKMDICSPESGDLPTNPTTQSNVMNKPEVLSLEMPYVGDIFPPNLAAAALLQDPVYMDSAKQTLEDPACVKLLWLIRNLYDELGENSDARCDAPVYSSAIKEFLAKPELVNNLKCFRKALMQDSSMLEKRVKTGGDMAPLKRDMTDEEIFQYLTEECRKNRGDPVAIERILSYEDILLNLVKECRCKIEDGSTTCENPADKYKNFEDEPYFAPEMFEADKKLKRTPLQIACGLGEVEEAEHLINNGADLGALDINGNTALHYASFCGSELCVRLLIKHGADVNLQNFYGESPYKIAELKKNTGLMKLLS